MFLLKYKEVGDKKLKELAYSIECGLKQLHLQYSGDCVDTDALFDLLFGPKSCLEYLILEGHPHPNVLELTQILKSNTRLKSLKLKTYSDGKLLTVQFHSSTFFERER